MSRDHDREEQRLRDLLEQARRGYDPDDELLDEEILHQKPKPKSKKKKFPKSEKDS